MNTATNTTVQWKKWTGIPTYGHYVNPVNKRRTMCGCKIPDDHIVIQNERTVAMCDKCKHVSVGGSKLGFGKYGTPLNGGAPKFVDRGKR